MLQCVLFASEIVVSPDLDAADSFSVPSIPSCGLYLYIIVLIKVDIR